MLAFLVMTFLVAIYIRGATAHDVVRLIDFRAFYCAGAALDAGRDPYLAEPLRSCEHAQIRAGGAHPIEFLAVPAPLPGYSLAFFALFARLPYAQAAACYLLLLMASLCVTVFSLQKLTGFSPFGIMGGLALCDGWVSMGYGQIVPIALMFLCAGAVQSATGRPVCAAFCAGGAMIEPHIALPACIALFLFERRARLPLAAAAVVLGAASVVAVGWKTNIEYLLTVLPAHALAEASNIGQFGLTTVLHRAGMDARLALEFADLSYAAMVTFGLIVARRLYARTNAREMLILVPPAFALLGGPFVHTSQMAVAVPALLVLLQRVPERRALLSMALLVMAIPWLELAENGLVGFVFAVASATAVVSIFVLSTNASRTLVIVVVMSAAAAGERYLRTAFPPVQLDLHAQLARVANGARFADATWAIHSRSLLGAAWYLASHLPAWTGLLLLVVAASSVGRFHVFGRRHLLRDDHLGIPFHTHRRKGRENQEFKWKRDGNDDVAAGVSLGQLAPALVDQLAATVN